MADPFIKLQLPTEDQTTTCCSMPRPRLHTRNRSNSPASKILARLEVRPWRSGGPSIRCIMGYWLNDLGIPTNLVEFPDSSKRTFIVLECSLQSPWSVFWNHNCHWGCELSLISPFAEMPGHGYKELDTMILEPPTDHFRER